MADDLFQLYEHPHDVPTPKHKNVQIHRVSTVHQKMMKDTRSTQPLSLKEHITLQKKMRKRINASNRDLLSQALHHRTATSGQNESDRNNIYKIINRAQAQNENNTSNDLIHTTKSFQLALAEEGSALKVLIMIGFKVINILRIDHVHLTFYATFQLYIEWNDPHLINATKPIQWEKEFDPNIICVNLVDGAVYSNVKELIDPSTGMVKQTIGIKGNLTIHETSFGPFPFDYQDLRIQVKSKNYPGHSILLVSEGTSLIEHHPREEFILSGLRTEVYTSNPHASRCGNSYSTMHIVIMVERDPTWYQRNIIITLSLIWAAAMVTLFMPFSTYDALGYRMESAIALLLASVATKFTVTEHLPKVSVLTYCDAHMTICFCGILLNIFTSIILYVSEKYAHPDSFSESMTDSTRFEHRKNYYGGQPCAYGNMILAHSITLFTLMIFIFWHIRICFIRRHHEKKRELWRSLALPESLELCGRPLPSILTQFNGQDTPVAKARNHLLSKFGNHLRRRRSENGELDTTAGKKRITSRSSYTVSPEQKKELIKEHSLNGML